MIGGARRTRIRILLPYLAHTVALTGDVTTNRDGSRDDAPSSSIKPDVQP